MKVVILAGGKGVRYGTDKPKALALIGNKPVIHHLMDIYTKQGFNNFIICLGWKQEEIIKYFKSINHTFNIEFIDTGQESHTAKRLKLIETYINTENFMCNYCDGLANVDLTKLNIRHMTYKNIATLTAVKPINPFGILIFDKNDRIIGLEEKPKMIQYINGGFFIFNKKIFDYIDIDKNQELERDVLSKLAYSNKLELYKHELFWETLNTPKDEINLNNIFNKCIENNEQLFWLRI
jgi:glucose-1-phosphate cytidylyltransferase